MSAARMAVPTDIRVCAIDQASNEITEMPPAPARAARWRCAASPASAWSRTARNNGLRSGAQTSTWFATASRANRRHRSDRKEAGMKFGGHQPMRNARARALLFSAVAALALYPALSPVIAAEPDAQPATTGAIGGAVKQRFLALGIGKSVIIDLPRDVKDVLVADPKIANAVVRSSQRAYIIGGAVGQTNVVFFDADGQQVASYDIAVKRDLNGVRTALKQTLPGVQIEGVGDSVVLTGSVSSPIEAQQAGDLAARLVGGAEKVVNSIAVRGRDQVMLKVSVSEVRRDIVKQMGVDLSASMNYGTAVVNFNNTNPFTAYGRPLVSDNGLAAAAVAKGLPTVQATMRAMESAGVVRTLAEPNL